MHLHSLSLLHFRNYQEGTFQFSPALNCFLGENGAGKTNLLDAIHYLSMTRSAFHSVEQQSIQHGEKFFMVSGVAMQAEERYQIVCSYQEGRKKLMVNKQEYDRLSEHIGRFPSVLISPDDTLLIREGSEVRRRFFDGMICQTDRQYLQALTRFNLALRQRNHLLRLLAEKPRTDREVLLPYNQLVMELSEQIGQRRADFLAEYAPVVQERYAFLTRQREQVGLRHKTHVTQPDFREAFLHRLPDDLHLLRTTMGAHRDDYEFTIGGRPLKKYGSQGQQKSYLISLKLAQAQLTHQAGGIPPLLLLDDIFDKLDEQRIGRLLEWLATGPPSQVFLTDARPERTRQFLAHLPGPRRYFTIENGKVAEVREK